MPPSPIFDACALLFKQGKDLSLKDFEGWLQTVKKVRGRVVRNGDNDTLLALAITHRVPGPVVMALLKQWPEEAELLPGLTEGLVADGERGMGGRNRVFEV